MFSFLGTTAFVLGIAIFSLAFVDGMVFNDLLYSTRSFRFKRKLKKYGIKNISVLLVSLFSKKIEHFEYNASTNQLLYYPFENKDTKIIYFEKDGLSRLLVYEKTRLVFFINFDEEKAIKEFDFDLIVDEKTKQVSKVASRHLVSHLHEFYTTKVTEAKKRRNNEMINRAKRIIHRYKNAPNEKKISEKKISDNQRLPDNIGNRFNEMFQRLNNISSQAKWLSDSDAHLVAVTYPNDLLRFANTIEDLNGNVQEEEVFPVFDAMDKSLSRIEHTITICKKASFDLEKNILLSRVQETKKILIHTKE